MKWLKQLFSRRRLYGDLSEEIQEHLEEKIEELVAGGMSRKEAAYAARREFGNVMLTEEDSRKVWRWPSIEDFFMDVRFGARMLGKNPGFTAIAVFTLALGIAANATMFSDLSAWMLKKPAVSDPDRLMVVYGTNSNELREVNQNPVSAPNFFAWKKGNRVFSQMAAMDPYEAVSLTGQGEPERVSVTRVTANYFSILCVSPALGRTFAVGEDQSGGDRAVTLSHALWERWYGSDPKVVGATVRLNVESHVKALNRYIENRKHVSPPPVPSEFYIFNSLSLIESVETQSEISINTPCLTGAYSGQWVISFSGGICARRHRPCLDGFEFLVSPRRRSRLPYRYKGEE